MIFGPFDKQCNGPRLHEELVTAGVAVISVYASNTQTWILAASDSSVATITNTVTAHNPATLSSSQQREQTDGGFLSDFRTQMQPLWDRLTQIEALPNNATTATVIAAVRDEATGMKRILRALDVLVRR
jgi:hypothetical protein